MIHYKLANRYNRIKAALIILVLACTLSCNIAEDAAKSNDEVNIQGTWLAQSESRNGIKKEVSYLYSFHGDTLLFKDETGQQTKYAFRLDTTGNPRYIIIRPVGTTADSAEVSVGYQLHGDSLTIVVAPAGLRPAEISDNNNQELIICRRKGS